jgi:hypothetical protein
MKGTIVLKVRQTILRAEWSLNIKQLSTGILTTALGSKVSSLVKMIFLSWSGWGFSAYSDILPE